MSGVRGSRETMPSLAAPTALGCPSAGSGTNAPARARRRETAVSGGLERYRAPRDLPLGRRGGPVRQVELDRRFSSGDRLGLLLPGDRHPPWLGRLGDRDRERQHAEPTVGLNALGVERFAEEDLAGVGSLRPLGHDHLVALSRLETPLGPHGQHILLDGQLDRLRLDARQVELDDEPVAAAAGVHRERPRRARRGGRELLGEPVELAERVKKAHDATRRR
jgi:hypothetical protein